MLAERTGVQKVSNAPVLFLRAVKGTAHSLTFFYLSLFWHPWLWQWIARCEETGVFDELVGEEGCLFFVSNAHLALAGIQEKCIYVMSTIIADNKSCTYFNVNSTCINKKLTI